MHKIIFTSKSRNDLKNIQSFISQDNEFYAIKTIENIKSTISILKTFPKIGKEIKNGKRFLVEKNYKYKIVYLIHGNNILILAIYKHKNTWQ